MLRSDRESETELQEREIGAQVVQNNPANPAENTSCAPTLGPQGGLNPRKNRLGPGGHPSRRKKKRCW